MSLFKDIPVPAIQLELQ